MLRKMERSGCDVFCSDEVYFPREIWLMTLRILIQSIRLPRMMRPRTFFRLSLVSRSWRIMVYESVTVIDEGFSLFVTDDVLKRFVSLQDLSRNHLISNVGIRSATTLTNLDLSFVRHVTDDGISGLTNLTSLQISREITVDRLKNLLNLRALGLFQTSVFSGDAILKLTNLTELKSAGSDMTVVGLAALTNLTKLSLMSCLRNYDDALSQLTNLTFLSVYSERNWIRAASERGLRGLTNLTELRSDVISDALLGTLTKLRTLNVLRAKVTDNGLTNLCNLTSLRVSHRFDISDFGISRLTKLSHLELTKMAGTVTDLGLSHLVNLTSLSVNGDITDAGISGLTNLTALNCEENKILTNAGIVGLMNLKAIALGENSNIGDDGIKGLTNLTELSLINGSCITFDGLLILSRLELLSGMEHLSFRKIVSSPNLLYFLRSILRGLFFDMPSLRKLDFLMKESEDGDAIGLCEEYFREEMMDFDQ